MIRTRYRLADCQRMQSRFPEALATYTWLIEVASDPHQSRDLPEASHWELASAFMDFVACGLFLPEMPAARLLQVIDAGLDWLAQTGHRDWSAGLRHLRALVFRMQGCFEEARVEAETALAQKKRTPDAPGDTLATHVLELAKLLREHLDRPKDALPLIEDLLQSGRCDTNDRWWAYKDLAFSHLALDDLEAAESAAREALSLAHVLEGPSYYSSTYQLLNRIHRRAGRIDDAVASAAQQIRWDRIVGTDGYLCNSAQDAARTRLLRARRACRVALSGDWPERLPADADLSAARRYLRSARRFLDRAQPRAERLDRQSNRRTFQVHLDPLRRRRRRTSRVCVHWSTASSACCRRKPDPRSNCPARRPR